MFYPGLILVVFYDLTLPRVVNPKAISGRLYIQNNIFLELKQLYLFGLWVDEIQHYFSNPIMLFSQAY
jgi:hypothetical protein